MKFKKERRNSLKQGKDKRLPFHLRGKLRWFAYIATTVILGLLLLFFVVSKYPSVGAEGADWLRGIIGDRAVAGLEMVVFNIQDLLQKVKYQLGLENPTEDWVSIATPSALPTFIPGTYTPSVPYLSPTPIKTGIVQPTPTILPSWPPANLSPMSSAPNEGVWISYIQDVSGNSVAYKTYMQPDPGRPYTLVTIVAVDLTHTRLHYVLGALDPVVPGAPEHTGKMPSADRAVNILLAEFNGGFQARHGQFGAMADGIQALPPRDGLGTVVIYQNGNVGLGEWGTDLYMTPDMDSYRQNGPPVIHKGQINIRIYNNSPQDWGYTVIDVSPTVRSGIGLSKDNKTLYYFCGPSLTMEALAETMLSTGAYNAIQLDINNYWVLFVNITQVGSRLVANPLLPRLMVDAVDRYLTQSPRDFFYITSLGTK